MFGLRSLLVLAASLTAGLSSPLQSRQSSLDSWLSSESVKARQGVLDNIGASGAKVKGAKAGVVVASPSNIEPPCVFSQNAWQLDD